MKKIRRAEFLLAVAIVTSAAVLQVREYMMKPPVQTEAATLSCGSTRSGLAPASCATAPRNQQPVDGTSRVRQPTTHIWV